MPEHERGYDALSAADLCGKLKDGDPLALHQISKRYSKYVGRVIWRPNQEWMTREDTVSAAWNTLLLFQRTLQAAGSECSAFKG